MKKKEIYVDLGSPRDQISFVGIPVALNLLSRKEAIKTAVTHISMGSASDWTQRVINDSEITKSYAWENN